MNFEAQNNSNQNTNFKGESSMTTSNTNTNSIPAIAAPAAGLPYDVFSFTTFYGKSIEEAIASKKPVAYVMDDEGSVYQVRNTANGTFVAKAKKVPGAKKIEEGFIRNPEMGLIPFEFFLQIVSFFRDVCAEFADDESMLQVYFDKIKKEYFLVCPEQTTTKTHITFLHDKALQNNENMVYVMDIHSHNSMSAFFSGTDDASEQETRLYGVVGRLDKEIPEYKFRISVEGDFIPMTIFDFFERPQVRHEISGISISKDALESDLFFPQVEYPSDWLEVIRKGKINRAAFSGKGNPRANGTFGIDLSAKPKVYGNTANTFGRPAPRSSKHSQLQMWDQDPFAVSHADIVENGAGQSFRDFRPDVSEFGTEQEFVEEAMMQRDALVDALVMLEDEERVGVVLPLLEQFSIQETEMLIDFLTQEGYFAQVQEALEDRNAELSAMIGGAVYTLEDDAKVDTISETLKNLSPFEMKRVLTELAENGLDYEMKEVLKNTGKM